MRLEIARVRARAVKAEVDFAELGVSGRRTTAMCFVEIETRDGPTGHGFTYQFDGPVLAQLINTVAGPVVIGDDAMNHERIWQKLYWHMTGCGQSGLATHAISAIDLALWDIKGKALNMPIWRLLGGSRDQVPVYATLGLPGMDRDEMAEMARQLVARGFSLLKIQVGRPGLQGDRPLMAIIKDDAERIAAVREAVGPDVGLAIDGSCKFDLVHAAELARRAEPFGIAWYEEPLPENDPRLLVELRRLTSIPLIGGQTDGSMAHVRDLLVAGAISMVQPSVSVAGGITQCVKIAGMAYAFHVQSIAGGGGCPYHSMHVQAGVPNGTWVEYQTSSARANEQIYRGLPKVEKGMITLGEGVGLGFDPDYDAIADLEVK